VDDALAFAPITRQAELIRSGELSPRELVELYLRRIDALDPQLNAFRIVHRERALAEADQAQARLKGATSVRCSAFPWRSRTTSTSPAT